MISPKPGANASRARTTPEDAMRPGQDPNEDFIRNKAREDLIGSTRFKLGFRRSSISVTGLLNVFQFLESNGSGYLSLSFFFDVGEDREVSSLIYLAFRRLDFTGMLGRGLVTVVRTNVELDSNRHLDMEEFTFQYTDLAGRQVRLVEKLLLPAFAGKLEIVFGEMDWMEEKKGLFRGLFGK